MKGLALVLALLPLAASAATITVTSTADNTTAGDGKCTLREAVANVNMVAETTGGDCAAGTGTGDTITFTLARLATIRIDQMLGDLAIQKNVTIIGPVTRLRIDGAHKTRVFEIVAGTTSISNLTIVNGSSIDRGGGVFVNKGAAVALSNCTLSGNSAGRDGFEGFGGGLYNSGSDLFNPGGTATLTNCTLSHNSAAVGEILGQGSGGGLYNSSGGTTTLTNCTLIRNSAGGPPFYGEGGGLYNRGNALLINTTLSANRTWNNGGGLSNGGTATLTNCTLSGNRAYDGGGVDNNGIITLISCTLGRNAASGGGGGLSNFGTATFTNCTLTSNRSPYGGGLENAGGRKLTLTNCTLSGNSAYSGNGIGNYGGIVTLTNCTFSRNWSRYGGGIHCFDDGFNASTAAVALTNTILADSGPIGNCRSEGCPFTSGGHNLSSDGTCFASSRGDLPNTDPQLTSPSNYGGPTATMALCTGPGAPSRLCRDTSPAIDAGDDAVIGPPGNLATDQRGLPRQAGDHVDIGAYEAQ